MDDRRQHPRYSAIELRAVWLSSEETPVQVRDVSTDGICLVSSEPAAPGSTIRVRLSLDFGQNRFSEPVELSYRVVWCTPVKELFQIGGAAIEMDAASRNHRATIVHCVSRDVSLDGELHFRNRE
jgi:hypothetical protein